MALLDVSELLTDPDFADEFPVKRRSQVTGNNGRVSIDEKDLEGVGVICAASPSDLRRLPEDQRTDRAISVVTQFRLRASAPDYQPDLVGWQGDFYVVSDIQPYTHFGSGFVQAICTSMSAQDQPPVEDSSDEPGAATEDDGFTPGAAEDA